MQQPVLDLDDLTELGVIEAAGSVHMIEFGHEGQHAAWKRLTPEHARELAAALVEAAVEADR